MALTIAVCFHAGNLPCRTATNVACVCFATACCLPFFTSSRKLIIFLLLDILIILNATKRLRSYHLITGAIAACTIGSLMLALRVADDSSFSNAANNVPGRIADGLFGTTNYLEITKTAAMQRSVPRVLPYKFGLTYPGVFYAPIPRTLFPSKPPFVLEESLRETVYGFRHGQGGEIPPGFIGETIWNFSTWLVLPACLITAQS